VIFFSNDEQKRIATACITQLDAAKAFPKPIITQVTPLKGFYRAGDCHQDYALHDPNNPYIQVCDLPEDQATERGVPPAFRGLQGQVITPAFKVAVRV